MIRRLFCCVAIFFDMPLPYLTDCRRKSVRLKSAAWGSGPNRGDIVVLDANISSRINLMRILLISGIVFVHVPSDPQTSPFLGTFGILDWLRVFLGDSLFRVGVPCLSAISGYLLFRRGLDDFDYGRRSRSKARTVLAPFLIWNHRLSRPGLCRTDTWGRLRLSAGCDEREPARIDNPCPCDRGRSDQPSALFPARPSSVHPAWRRFSASCQALSAGNARPSLRLCDLPVPNVIFLKKSILFGFSCRHRCSASTRSMSVGSTPHAGKSLIACFWPRPSFWRRALLDRPRISRLGSTCCAA